MFVPSYVWPGVFLMIWIALIAVFENVSGPKTAREHLVIIFLACLGALAAIPVLMFANWILVVRLYRVAP